MSKTVVVVNGTVRIEALAIEDVGLCDYLSRFADDEKPDAVSRAAATGAAILDRFESSQNMDFVRQQADAIMASIKGTVQAIPTRLQAELLPKLGTADGQALAPVAALVAQSEKVVNARLLEVQSLLNDHIDPRRSDSTLGIALSSLNTMLDPKHEDSVQKAVQNSLASVTDKDGALALAVHRIVEETVKPLRETLTDLAKEIRGQQAVAEALEQTTAKGRPFEEELLPTVRTWAAAIGADVEHVGPDNQPGDILVTLNECGMTSIDLSIVIEARDDQSSRGRKRILDGMATALTTRQADCGIYVGRTIEALAKEIGDWSELQSQGGPVVACTAEHLRTALRFLVAEQTIRQMKSATPEADTTAIEAEVARVRTALGRIRTINTKTTAIRTATDTISTEAAELKREIADSLCTIEDAIRKDSSVGRAVA